MSAKTAWSNILNILGKCLDEESYHRVLKLMSIVGQELDKIIEEKNELFDKYDRLVEDYTNAQLEIVKLIRECNELRLIKEVLGND